MGQNVEDGTMHGIDRETFAELRAKLEQAKAEQRLAEATRITTAAGQIIECVGALVEGEEIEVRGCRFRVAEIGRRFVILEGIPTLSGIGTPFVIGPK